MCQNENYKLDGGRVAMERRITLENYSIENSYSRFRGGYEHA